MCVSSWLPRNVTTISRRPSSRVRIFEDHIRETADAAEILYLKWEKGSRERKAQASNTLSTRQKVAWEQEKKGLMDAQRVRTEDLIRCQRVPCETLESAEGIFRDETSAPRFCNDRARQASGTTNVVPVPGVRTTPRRVHGTADSSIAWWGEGEELAEPLHSACCGEALRQTSMNRWTEKNKRFKTVSPFGQQSYHMTTKIILPNEKKKET